MSAFSARPRFFDADMDVFAPNTRFSSKYLAFSHRYRYTGFIYGIRL
jgi:hypothetical protein